MRKHSIESLDEFLHSTIHPAGLLQMAPEQAHSLIGKIKELAESIRRELLQDMLNSKTEQETEFLIERHQIIVGIYLNLLYEYQQYESITPGINQLYQQATDYLEGFIIFLKKTFPHYFNTNLTSPLPYLHREGQEIKRQWKLIRKTTSEENADSRLLNILDKLVKGLFTLAEEAATSYRQIYYIKDLIRELSAYFSSRAPSSIYASLTDLLISWNFNELTFILEICNRLKMDVDQKESDEHRREFLWAILKQMSQLAEKSGQSFNVTQSSAKHMISEWISLELAYWQANTNIQEDRKSQRGAKIHTSLSVPVLALFTRLLKDSGIYTNSSQEEIIKFVSSHYTTHRKLEVSIGHLHSKYYQIDEGTKKKVYEHLMEMAQRCKKL